MAITDKEEGVWELEQVYNKQNQGGIWSYDSNTYNLFVWGGNRFGNLGLNQGYPSAPYGNRSSPTQVPGNTWTTKVSGSAGSSTKAIKNDGTLWTWGRNNKGQLGLGNKNNYSSPTQVGTATTWDTVASMHYGSMAVKTDGTLWTWGRNNWGQLGQNNKSEYANVTQVGTDSTWSHTMKNTMAYGIEPPVGAIKTDGSLWSWGYNNYMGALGLNDRQARSSPCQLPGTTWRTVAWGLNTAAATKTDGSLWTWGRNGQGQLGHEDTTPRSSPVQVPGTWSNVSINRSQAISAVKTDGTLWTWGYNENAGALGHNNQTNYSSPKQVGTDTNWSSTSVGYMYMFGIKTDGTLWSWGGAETDGTMGLNSIIKRSSPTQVGGTWTEAYGIFGHSAGVKQL